MLQKLLYNLGHDDNELMSSLEVRVGGVDASDPANNPLSRPNDDNKMCVNRLCYTSGKPEEGPHLTYVDQDCITPLSGRFEFELVFSLPRHYV